MEQMTLSPVARELASVIRRHKLTYAAFNKACHQARKACDMKPTKGARKLPQLLTEAQLRAFYAAIDKADNLKHRILLRLLFYTAVRVDELCAIKTTSVDLLACKIFIDDGKGSKDRYVLFPAGFGLALRAYIESQQAGNEYLFESNYRRRYSTRRIQQIVKEYAEAAGLARVHPHLLRHQMLTFLTGQGLADSQIQLISGHASKSSLERYQHMSLDHAQGDYQDALRKVGI